MTVMAKEKKEPKKYDRERYRKPRRHAGIPEPVARQVDILVERNASDFSEEVRRAVVKMLEAEGLWPPAKEEKEGE